MSVRYSKGLVLSVELLCQQYLLNIRNTKVHISLSLFFLYSVSPYFPLINLNSNIAAVLLYISIITYSFAFLMVASAINGFINLAIFSVAYEMGVEMTYPIGEAMSGGFINTMANVIGFVIVMILTPILTVGE
jgi:uncharacterized protein YebE (UPF0316 family)